MKTSVISAVSGCILGLGLSICAQAGGGGDGGWSAYNALSAVLRNAGLSCVQVSAERTGAREYPSLVTQRCGDGAGAVTIRQWIDYFNSDEQLVKLQVANRSSADLASDFTRAGYACEGSAKAMSCTKDQVEVALIRISDAVTQVESN